MTRRPRLPVLGSVGCSCTTMVGDGRGRRQPADTTIAVGVHTVVHASISGGHVAVAAQAFKRSDDGHCCAGDSWRPQSTELFTAPVATLSRSHLAVHSQAVFTIRDRGPAHLRSSVSRRVRHAAVCAVSVGRHRRGNRCHVGGVDHSPPTHQGRPVATVSADRDITRRTAQHCIAEEPAVLRSSVGSGVSICATAALVGCSP